MLDAVQKAGAAALKERKASLARKLPPQERAERVIDAFLSAANGVTIADLNQAQAKLARPEGKAVGFTVEGFLLQNLSSIAYEYREPELIQAARRRGIDFTQDGYAALLARTAGVDDSERMRETVDTLIDVSLMEAETTWFPRHLGSFGRSTRRYAARRLAALPSTAAGTGLDVLKNWFKYQPKMTPTPAKDQGPTGRWEPERGYVGPAPDQAPSLTPGQSFLYLPSGDDLVLTDSVTRKPVPAAAYVFKKLTLQAVESIKTARNGEETPLRLRFTLAGYPNPVVWEGDGDLYDLPSLHPLTDDAAVRGLRTRYQNKTVWGYGGSVGVETIMANSRHSLSLGFDNDPRRGAAVIRRIFRLRSGSPFILSMGSSPGYAGERSSSFATREPLVVLLELPAGMRLPSSSSSLLIEMSQLDLGRNSSDNSESTSDRLMKSDLQDARPLAYYAVFADAWDFEREYSLISLDQASKNWPAKLRRAVRQQEMTRGMTPEMTAWLMGFPGQYGTKADLLSSPGKEWRYDDLPPHDHLIYFKNGLVSGWYRSQSP